MSLYWRVKSIPELAGLDRRDRKRVWRRAVRCAGAEGAIGTPLLVHMAISFVTLPMALEVMKGLDAVKPIAVTLVVMGYVVVMVAIARLFLMPWYIHRVRPFVRRYLMSGV